MNLSSQKITMGRRHAVFLREDRYCKSNHHHLLLCVFSRSITTRQSVIEGERGRDVLQENRKCLLFSSKKGNVYLSSHTQTHTKINLVCYRNIFKFYYKNIFSFILWWQLDNSVMEYNIFLFMLYSIIFQIQYIISSDIK